MTGFVAIKKATKQIITSSAEAATKPASQAIRNQRLDIFCGSPSPSHPFTQMASRTPLFDTRYRAKPYRPAMSLWV
ncbi:hypothetical protein [Ottowia massiliensis]|uniref:hypothetical protein n=1 Tax=Ottowia massiliensis TaxID=2045302 RepID=UPI0011AF9DFB|nr:hypothetical protein [Ottowia massiliensis]